jgi:hypothetical protein
MSEVHRHPENRPIPLPENLKHKTNEAVGVDHIVLALNDEEESFDYFITRSLRRSFVNTENLPNAAVEVLREVLANQYIPRDLSKEGVKLCYERGWLHSEPLDADAKTIVCIFPTKLHAKYVFSFYYAWPLADPIRYVEHVCFTGSSVPFPKDNKFPNVRELAKSVLKTLSIS